MSDARGQLRLQLFEKALAALRLALQQPEDEFVRDSIIKRFELSYETLRKCLRDWLLEQEEIDVHATRKDVMEAALRTGLVEGAELWDDIRKQRNDCSHEYDAARAIVAVSFIRDKAFVAFEAVLDELKHRL